MHAYARAYMNIDVFSFIHVIITAALTLLKNAIIFFVKKI